MFQRAPHFFWPHSSPSPCPGHPIYPIFPYRSPPSPGANVLALFDAWRPGGRARFDAPGGNNPRGDHLARYPDDRNIGPHFWWTARRYGSPCDTGRKCRPPSPIQDTCLAQDKSPVQNRKEILRIPALAGDFYPSRSPPGSPPPSAATGITDKKASISEC